MTKSNLIQRLALLQTHLTERDVELAVKLILDRVSATIAAQERVEIRGFGSFHLHRRRERIGRNPRTGGPVSIPVTYVPRFKAGRELRARVDLNSQKK